MNKTGNACSSGARRATSSGPVTLGERVATVFPGDPYSRPWEDLAQLGHAVETEWFQLGTYFICIVGKL
jgi:hypothetical protein